jgi:hypothetical protein
MEKTDTVIAVFEDHEAAESAVKKLSAAGFEVKNLSVVGKGYHSEEKVVGFYNIGDRVKFWGGRGAFWGGLWGLFFGGLFLSIPVVGHVVVLGYLGALVVSAIESAVVVGGASALGAALYSIGVPKDSVIQYETAVKADGFLVMAHGSADEMARAKEILSTTSPSRLDLHADVPAAEPKTLVSNLRHPGWLQGWGVTEGNQPNLKFAGIFSTQEEAQAAAAHAGPGYEVRWGSYDERNEEFVSGNSR